MGLGKSPTQYKGVLAKRPPDVVFAERNPITGTDKAFVQGDIWLNTTGLTAWMFVSVGATWIALGTGSLGGISTITGDVGGPQSPLAGNFSINGTANQITVTGTANKVTLSLSSTLAAPGSFTATSGNITAANGNIVRGTAGNKDIYSSVATTTTAGANSAGTVTLTGGTATISTTTIAAGSKVRLVRQGVGATGAAALGILTLGTITAGVSFVINAVQAASAIALQATDVSSIWWEIVN